MATPAVLRVEKLKSKTSLRLALQHDTRDRMPAHADKDRLELNVVERTTEEAMRLFEERLPASVRKNAIYGAEFLVQARPDTAKPVLEAYFKEALAWCCAKVGGERNRLSYAFHLDEDSPHLHLVVMPLKEGKLNYTAYLGGSKYKLKQLQTDFVKEVAGRYGYERGIERSGIEHRYHDAYRQQMAAPLTGLPEVQLPSPAGYRLNLKAYGEEIAHLYREAYEPLIRRLTSVTNRVKVLENDKHQLMLVNSGRAEEYDRLRRQLKQLHDILRADDAVALKRYRAALLEADQKTAAMNASKTKSTGKPKNRDDDRGR